MLHFFKHPVVDRALQFICIQVYICLYLCLCLCLCQYTNTKGIARQSASGDADDDYHDYDDGDDGDVDDDDGDDGDVNDDYGDDGDVNDDADDDYKEECWLCPSLEWVKKGEQGRVSPPK